MKIQNADEVVLARIIAGLPVESCLALWISPVKVPEVSVNWLPA
jgi:hypothetical protein